MLNFAIVGIGPTEIIIVLVLVLILFGAKRLPEAGRSLGQGMREFKDSVTGRDRGPDEHEPNDELPADSATTGDEGDREAPAATGSTPAGEPRR